MISPDPIHACWEGSNGFCVAGATISMPLRCSPPTLYMLVGKCQMAFVWQVQQFRCLWDDPPLTLYMLVGKGQRAFVWQVQQLWCLWDDLPWPFTCLLGRVKWLLCGRCNNFDASEMFSPDPIHAGWEVSNGFCVAGAAILMPLRWSPLTLYMLVGKCQMAFVWQVQQFSDASEMISPDPIHACWEGSNGFWVAGATILMPLRWSPLTLYMLVGKGQMAFVWQVQQFSMPLRWSPLTLYMLVGKGQMAFEWQVQQFWCLWDDLPWPYTCLLGSVKWLLCGRCNNFDASEMISPDPIHACWEGSQVIDSDFVWPVQ